MNRLCAPALVLALWAGGAHAEWAGGSPLAVGDDLSIRALVEPVGPQATLLQPALEDAFTTELPDVGLWKFIASVRAMQSEEPLLLLQGHLSILESTSPPPTVVPLPGAAWFMLMGLLGLAGVRLGGARRRDTQSPAPWPAQRAAALVAVSH